MNVKQVEKTRLSKLAFASMVIAVLSLPTLVLLPGLWELSLWFESLTLLVVGWVVIQAVMLLVIGLGLLAHRQITKANGTRRGYGLAIAAIIIGAFGATVAWDFYPGYYIENSPLKKTDAEYIRGIIANNLAPKASDLTSEDLLKVKSLNLNRRCWVRDISVCADLPNLEVIDLSDTQVKDLSPLSRLKRLKSIMAPNTPITDLGPLRNLTELKDLQLINTQVSDLTPLQGLKNLEWLMLDNTQVSDLEPLRDIPNLHELSFRNTPAAAQGISWPLKK